MLLLCTYSGVVVLFSLFNILGILLGQCNMDFMACTAISILTMWMLSGLNGSLMQKMTILPLFIHRFVIPNVLYVEHRRCFEDL